MRIRILLAAVAAPLVLWAAMPVITHGQSGLSSIQSKIESKRRAVEAQKGRERALTADIQSVSSRIGALQDDITGLQRRQVAVQAELDAERRELARTQELLRQERARLVRLRARLAEGRAALAARLVELYKADEPDILTVVLDADGFADLLERTEFMQRVAGQDRRIIVRVEAARAEATATAARLGRLERRRQRATAAILERRAEIAAVRSRLVDRRDRYRRVRGTRVSVLERVRVSRRQNQTDLAALERASARITAKLQAAAPGGGTLRAGPIRPGSGRLIWPVNGTITSPFGPRWGRLHAGIDIGAPEGTPIRAADSGKVVVAGWEGAYGNYTCIQHGGGLATCYAHQASIGVSSGQTVSQGAVIGTVGNTGRSFGAHLHFETRVGGSPQDPLGYL